MDELKYFMHRIKRTSGNWDKGIEVKDSIGEAKQSYHAHLGAYAYGHDQNTDYVQCIVTDMYGGIVMSETWKKPETVPNAE